MPADQGREIILKGALAGKARVLVGLDAHLMHHFAKLLGSRYQDVVAALHAAWRRPTRSLGRTLAGDGPLPPATRSASR